MEKQTVNKKEVYNTYIMLNSTQRINVRLFSNCLGDRKIIFKKKKKKEEGKNLHGHHDKSEKEWDSLICKIWVSYYCSSQSVLFLSYVRLIRSLPQVSFQTTQFHSHLISLLLDSGRTSVAASRRCWVSQHCTSASDFCLILPHPWYQIGKRGRGKRTRLTCHANANFTFDRSDWRSNESKDFKIIIKKIMFQGILTPF